MQAISKNKYVSISPLGSSKEWRALVQWISNVRAFEKTFKTFVLDALEGTKNGCPLGEPTRPSRGRWRSSAQSSGSKNEDGGSSIFVSEERRWGEFLRSSGSKNEDVGVLRSSGPKNENGRISAISQPRRSNIGWALRSQKPEDRRTPHLRRIPASSKNPPSSKNPSSSKNPRSSKTPPSSIFGAEEQRTSHLQPSIFGPEDRRTTPSNFQP